jgi:COMPASS component SWD3
MCFWQAGGIMQWAVLPPGLRHLAACGVVAAAAPAALQATGSYDETIRFWDVRSGRCLRELPAHSDPITGIA